MIKGTRRTVAAAAAALGLGIGSAVWATSAASAAPAGPAAVPECATASLAVWVSAGGGNGGAGTIHYPLEFTNISGRACYLIGWPGVSAVNVNGRQLGSAAQRNNVAPRKAVTLAPGATAHADLGYVDVQVYPGSNCKQTTAAYLKVYPPDMRTATRAFFDLPVCTVNGHIYLTISRIEKGVTNP